MKRRNGKYDAKPMTLDGVRFASEHEGLTYLELKARRDLGEIAGLRLQVPYHILVNGQKVCTYQASFVYWDRHGREHVVDARGYRTAVYRLKVKLLRAVLGIEVEEV